jgi:hypothetical protein
MRKQATVALIFICEKACDEIRMEQDAAELFSWKSPCKLSISSVKKKFLSTTQMPKKHVTAWDICATFNKRCEKAPVNRD